MSSVLALVSKGEFEKEHGKSPATGQVLPIAAYASTNAGLTTLGDGGDLYLVTVRPGEELWLVAVLRAPRSGKKGWTATTNTTPITALAPVARKLRFANGKGISTEPGKLGMSLQTPRTLTDDDVRILEATLAGRAPTIPRIAEPRAPQPQPAPTPALEATPSVPRPPRPSSVPADAILDLGSDRWMLGQRDADGLMTGVWREWRRDGSLRAESTLVAGELHGLQTELHPDGSPALTAVWHDGAQGETTSFPPRTKETDFTALQSVADTVAKCVSVPDGRWAWRTGALYDARGREVTARGTPVPPRPSGVPATARYVDADAAATPPRPAWWVDCATEQVTNTPVGRHRAWSLTGSLMHTTEYTRRGRQIWSFESIAKDPRDEALEAFFANPTEWRSRYDLCQIWTPELHERVRARLVKATSAHLLAYVDALRDDIEWHLEEAVAPPGMPALALALIDEWIARGDLAGKETATLLGRKLAWLLELHDKPAVKACSALLTAHAPKPRKDDDDDSQLRRRAKELLAGTTDRELDKVHAALRKGGGEITSESFLALARRELAAFDLKVFLGSPGVSEVLLLDGCKRAYVFDTKDFRAAPLEVDDTSRSNARYFRSYDGCDERLVFWSGQHVWWTLQRYGRQLFLQGSLYFGDRGQAETIRDAFIRCPDLAWTRRVMAMFAATLPKAARKIDVFYNSKLGSTLVREYEAHGNHEPFGSPLSRGVHGDTIVSGGGSPGVLRLYMLEGKEGKAPKVLERYPSHEEAVARFDRFETSLFVNGYSLSRIVALPMAVPDPSLEPRVIVKPARVAVPVLGKVAASVLEPLTKAAACAKANDLRGALGGLREAWSLRPAPAIAAALDELSARAPSAPELAGRSKPSLARWNEAEKTRDPSALGGLLATLVDVPSTEVLPRLERLLAWPEDPRLDAALAKIAWEVPFTSSGTQKVWRRIFRRLASSRDARILDRLKELPRRYKKEWASQTGDWAREQVEAILAERTPTFDELARLDLTPKEQASLDALLRSGGKVAKVEGAADREAAIAAILASPADDALRRRYAETFASSGDVRAELIALQLRGAAIDKAGALRIKELQTQHTAALSGPLAKLLNKGATFRLGFLGACTVRSSVQDVQADSPWWGTVEELDACYEDDLILSPQLRSLRSLEGVSFHDDGGEDDGRRGSTLATWPRRELLQRLQISIESAKDLRALLQSDRLPALTTLELRIDRRFDSLAKVLRGPVAERLESLVVIASAGSTQTLLHPNKVVEEKHDRTAIECLVELWASAQDLPVLRTLEARVVYGDGAPVVYRVTRATDGTAQLLVNAPGRYWGWWAVVLDNTCALLHALKGSTCTSASVSAKLPTAKEFAAKIEGVARQAKIAVDTSRVRKE